MKFMTIHCHKFQHRTNMSDPSWFSPINIPPRQDSLEPGLYIIQENGIWRYRHVLPPINVEPLGAKRVEIKFTNNLMSDVINQVKLVFPEKQAD